MMQWNTLTPHNSVCKSARTKLCVLKIAKLSECLFKILFSMDFWVNCTHGWKVLKMVCNVFQDKKIAIEISQRYHSISYISQLAATQQLALWISENKSDLWILLSGMYQSLGPKWCSWSITNKSDLRRLNFFS